MSGKLGDICGGGRDAKWLALENSLLVLSRHETLCGDLYVIKGLNRSYSNVLQVPEDRPLNQPDCRRPSLSKRIMTCRA